MQATHPAAGMLAHAYRSTTLGIVALISLLAFEHLVVATVMPIVATALGGRALYAAACRRWSPRAGSRRRPLSPTRC